MFSSTWFLSWLHVSSNLTWFYNLTWLLTWLTWLNESSLFFKRFYIVSNIFPSSDIKAENVLSTEKKMYCCCTRFYKHFVTIAELSYDTNKWKEKSLNAACAFYSKHKDKFTSPKNKLLAFLVKANTA